MPLDRLLFVKESPEPASKMAAHEPPIASRVKPQRPPLRWPPLRHLLSILAAPMPASKMAALGPPIVYDRQAHAQYSGDVGGRPLRILGGSVEEAPGAILVRREVGEVVEPCRCVVSM